MSNAEWQACVAFERASGNRTWQRPLASSTLISAEPHTTQACLAGALQTSEQPEKVANLQTNKRVDSRYTPRRRGWRTLRVLGRRR